MSAPELRELVPHSGRALLLDRLVAVDDTTLTAEVTIREDSRFAESDGVGAWIGIEYMAQAAAALAGHELLRSRARVRPGLLLGTRRYASNEPRFPIGARLTVSVRCESSRDDGVGLYACSIAGDGILAEATMIFFQPADPDQLLTGGSR